MDPYIEMLAADAQPDTEVMFSIDDRGKWLLSYKDAYLIASMLNSASRVRGRYHKGETYDVVAEPEESACIRPITGRHRILWDSNERMLKGDSK